MIETKCLCGAPFRAPESNVGKSIPCTKCGKPISIVCAEQLPDGAGDADFDARLIIQSGPTQVGQQLLLGGVQEITLGKLPDRNIPLPGGKLVSRSHCKLVRLDFGPSRWELQDNKSTNGVFVNGERVESQELQNGDVVQVGDYEFRFRSIAAPAPVSTGPVCPSCGKPVPANAKICVNCGVDVKTGRSLVISKGLDENDLAIRADTWIRILSWFIPFGLFPIASEAYGTKKATATWVIFCTTIAASLLFLFALLSQPDQPSPAVLNLMQWNGDPQVVDARVETIMRQLDEAADDAGKSSPSRAQAEAARRRIRQILARRQPEGVEFRWYQLFTSAMLHQPVLLMPFILHLGGNMLFLLVFGLRVNELVGNWRMTIVYPLLAAASAMAHHLSLINDPLSSSLGASGAIMGLAGMYFVFFPAQRVHMAIWFRGGILTRWQVIYKVFQMRGFWLLVCWIGFNDVLPMFIGSIDQVAHWAHLGGFLSGVVLALALLISRQTSAHGSDILSVILGRRAWSLVGRPAQQFAT